MKQCDQCYRFYPGQSCHFCPSRKAFSTKSFLPPILPTLPRSTFSPQNIHTCKNVNCSNLPAKDGYCVTCRGSRSQVLPSINPTIQQSKLTRPGTPTTWQHQHPNKCAFCEQKHQSLAMNFQSATCLVQQFYYYPETLKMPLQSWQDLWVTKLRSNLQNCFPEFYRNRQLREQKIQCRQCKESISFQSSKLIPSHICINHVYEKHV